MLSKVQNLIVCCILFGVISAIFQDASAQQVSTESDSINVVAQAKDWIDIGSKIITAVIAIIAGGFAWYKFVKGRVFRPRFKLSITASQVKLAGYPYILSFIEVSNVGAANVKIKEASIQMRPITPATTEGFRSKQTTFTEEVLSRHTWVDSGLTVREEHLTASPTTEDLAIDLNFRVVAFGPRGWLNGGKRTNISYSTTTIAMPRDSGVPSTRNGKSSWG